MQQFSQHGFLSLHPVSAGGPTHMGDLPMLLLMRSMQHSTVPCEACGAGRRRKRAMLDRSTAAACGCFRPDELCWPLLDCCADAVPAQDSKSHRWAPGPLCWHIAWHALQRMGGERPQAIAALTFGKSKQSKSYLHCWHELCSTCDSGCAELLLESSCNWCSQPSELPWYVCW